MYNNLVVGFEGIDLTNDLITGLDGMGINAIKAGDLASDDSNEYEIRQNFNTLKRLTITNTVPTKRTIEVNNSGVWILAILFHKHPVHKH